MKKRLLFLFLISILFISSCAELGPRLTYEEDRPNIFSSNPPPLRISDFENVASLSLTITPYPYHTPTYNDVISQEVECGSGTTFVFCDADVIGSDDSPCHYYPDNDNFGHISAYGWEDGNELLYKDVAVVLGQGPNSLCWDTEVFISEGSYFEITYDGGKIKRIYLPEMYYENSYSHSLILFIAEDGSTYYDKELTDLAYLTPEYCDSHSDCSEENTGIAQQYCHYYYGICVTYSDDYCINNDCFLGDGDCDSGQCNTGVCHDNLNNCYFNGINGITNDADCCASPGSGECTTNSDCTSSDEPYCEDSWQPNVGTCVECLTHANCPYHQYCSFSGSCITLSDEGKQDMHPLPR